MSEKARKRTDFVGTTSVGVGAPAADGVYVEEQGGRGVHRTVIGLNKVKVTVGNTTGVSFGGTKIYDFPAGLILVKQCVMKDIVVGLDNAGNVTPIDAADGGDISLGSTPPSDGTLAGTDVNLCPSTSIDPLSTGIATANLAASAQLGSQPHHWTCT